MTDIIIAGVAYTPRTMTAGDVGAIVPIVRRLQTIEAGAGVMDLADLLPDALTATAAALGCDRDLVAALPLHEALDVIRRTMAGWMDANAPYISTLVLPQLQALTAAIVEVSTALTQVHPPPPPAS